MLRTGIYDRPGPDSVINQLFRIEVAFPLDWIEIMLIILPLLAPVVAGMESTAERFGKIGDPTLIRSVMLVALALQISVLTQPVGFALFYLKGVCPPGSLW